MHNTITLNNLSFAFNATSPLFFDALSCTMQMHQLYFLQGVNGSGKSTLFRIIQGDVDTHEIADGSITIDGIEYHVADPDHRTALHAMVHVVQQDYSAMLADQFTFAQNLQFAQLPTYPTLTALPTYRTIDAFVERFGIAINRPVQLLSGGQRQIVAILMMLQKNPRLLLLDEPTAALDPANTAMVFTFLHELVKITQLTVLVITHDQTVMQQYAQDYFALRIDPTTGIRTLSGVNTVSVQ